MPPPLMDLRDNQMMLYLETNRAVDLGRFVSFLAAVNELARLPHALGPDVELELTSVSTGSAVAVISAYGGLIGGLGSFATFGLLVYQEVARGRRKVASRAAYLVLDDDVVAIEIHRAGQTPLVIQTNEIAILPEVERRRFERQRLADERAYEDAGFAYLATEDGTPVVTETGERIAVGGPTSAAARTFLDEGGANSGSFIRPFTHSLSAENLETSSPELSRPVLEQHGPAKARVRTSTFATQRVPGAKPQPDRNRGLTLFGRFSIAPDGAAMFHTGGRSFRVDTPGATLGPVPIGPEMLVEGQPFGGDGSGFTNGIHVFSARPVASGLSESGKQ